MDPGTFLLQAAQNLQVAAAQLAPQVGDLATRTADASVATKIMTDFARAAWGGDLKRDPPAWFAPLCAMVFGAISMSLVALMLGMDLTEPRVIGGAVFLGMLTGGGGAIAISSIHQSTRYTPPPPVPPAAGQMCPTCHRAMPTASVIEAAVAPPVAPPVAPSAAAIPAQRPDWRTHA